MSKTLPAVKRGDTFSALVTWAGASIEQLKSQVRDEKENLLSDVTLQETETADTFRLVVLQTNTWPIGKVYTDIQRTFTGAGGDIEVQSSETLTIPVVKDVTA